MIPLFPKKKTVRHKEPYPKALPESAAEGYLPSAPVSKTLIPDGNRAGAERWMPLDVWAFHFRSIASKHFCF